jgi:hypothetical protein
LDKKEKKLFGVVSFLPIFAWFAAVAYFIYINRNLILTKTFQDQKGVTTNISNHYLALTIFLSVAALITGIAIIYFVIHVVRLKSLTRLTKLWYIVFLMFTGPIAILFLWFILLKKEPENVAMYPDIT